MKVSNITLLVLLVLLVLIVLFVFPLPLQAQAGEHALEWSQIGQPGLYGNTIVTPSEVNEISVGSGDIIYALDTSNNATKSAKIYKSINGGVSWLDITSNLVNAGAVLPATKIAIAPDTATTIATVTDNGTKVHLSFNGGDTWTNTNVPGLVGKIQAIVISKQYYQPNMTICEIAIGTAVWGDAATTGQVWVLQVGTPVAAWQNQNLTIDPAHIGGEVSAIAYTYDFQGDRTMIVTASTSNDVAVAYQSQTWLCLGKRNTSSGNTSWNSPAFSGYPVAIDTSAGDAVGVLKISSSLALPSNYSSNDTSQMQLFTSFNRDPDAPLANDDVYSVNNTIVRRLNANGGAAINISSLDYYGTIGSGKLLAGDVDPVAGTPFVQVRRTINPYDTPPTWNLAYLPPTGPGNDKVSWSTNGTTVYCGTGQSPGVALDESAFSVSYDDGNNWQQLNLIDTDISLDDIAVTPDSKTLFLSTNSTGGLRGIWRSTLIEQGIGEFWTRQLTLNTAPQRLIMRLSSNYTSDYTLYVIEAGGYLIEVSHNRGNSWNKRYAPGNVVDAVVADKNTIYVALDSGCVSRSTDSGIVWGIPVPTGLTDINMLTITANGVILVGGRNGEVAYSIDGGASFTLIREVIGAGDVQVVGDAYYQVNHIIYAATNDPNNGIWRWQIGTSTNWEQIDRSIGNLGIGQCIGGLVTGTEGTLYALRIEPAGGISRSLNPAALADTGAPEFEVTNQGLPIDAAFDSSVIFTHTVPYLKLSTYGTDNYLWSIDTAHGIIYRFEDTLAINLPAQISPVNMFQQVVNSVTGRAADISFRWNAPSANVTDYEVGIYADAACTVLLRVCYIASTNQISQVFIGPYQPASSNQCLEYYPGTSYYWHVRAIQPLKSHWSTTFTFTIQPIPEPVPALLSPQNGATDVSQTTAFSWSPMTGASEYQLMVANDVSFTSPIVAISANNTGYVMTEKLEYGNTYFWKIRTLLPIEGAWSTVANFTVEQAPSESSPPVIVQGPSQPQQIVLTLALSAQPSIDPVSIWAIIGIGSILVIALIVLIIRTAS